MEILRQSWRRCEGEEQPMGRSLLRLSSETPNASNSREGSGLEKERGDGVPRLSEESLPIFLSLPGIKSPISEPGVGVGMGSGGPRREERAG